MIQYKTIGRLAILLAVVTALLSTLTASVPTAYAASPATTSSKDAVPRFEEDRCQFNIPEGYVQGKSIVCGFVIVPEDHAKPDGATIKLAVAIFKTASATAPKDAVIYLDGGPGGYSLASADGYAPLFAPLIEDRDLIMFDQRGVGYSEPSLTCPNLTDLYYKQLGEKASIEKQIKDEITATKACQQKLQNSGVHLDKYNTIQNAADVDAIRQALGYDALNLYGISYGTRLALETMRDFPKTTRSVVIDSVVPLEGDFDAGLAKGADRAFKELFKSCAVNPSCNSSFPDLEKVFYKLVDDLNAKPVTVKAKHPVNGKTYDVLVDGKALINYLFQSMYATSLLADIPGEIYNAKNGQYGDIANRLLLFTYYDELFSIGMNYSVNCNEETAFADVKNFDSASKDMPPALKDIFRIGVQEEQDICKFWGAGKGPSTEDQPVKSEIPALVTGGTFDPITPPAYAQQVAANLSNSTFFQFPGGHGASLDSECAQDIVKSFIDNPTEKPDGECVKTLQDPTYTVPISSLTAEMVPFTNAKLGISGLAPKGWTEVEDGVFSAFGANNLRLRLVHRVRPDGVKGYLAFLTKANNLTLPDPVDSFEANGLKWTVYTIDNEGVTFNVAGADVDGTGYVIVLLSPTQAQQEFYDKIFLPDVKAFKVEKK